MSARHLRNIRAKLDPNDHGYDLRESAEPGEIAVEREAFDQTDIEVDYDQRPRRARKAAR